MTCGMMTREMNDLEIERSLRLALIFFFFFFVVDGAQRNN